ncbi:MAG: OmpH family outer membrane protein [Opitutaceae bacterium]
MKKSVKLLVAFAALAISGAALQAQSAPKILVVDMIKLLDEHYKTQEQKQKLEADAQKAQEEAERLLKARNTLIEEYKEAFDQVNNPATTQEVKNQARTTAEQKQQEIQRKENELQSFQANTRNLLQQRFQNFKTIMLEEIGKIASDIAKRKGATLLLDKSGPNLLGISSVIHADATLDITADVEAEINRGRTAASAPAASSSSDSPSVSVPLGK